MIVNGWHESRLAPYRVSTEDVAIVSQKRWRSSVSMISTCDSWIRSGVLHLMFLLGERGFGWVLVIGDRIWWGKRVESDAGGQTVEGCMHACS